VSIPLRERRAVCVPQKKHFATNLQELNLWTNQLTGIIPTETENLSNLQIINLAGNQLIGSIPSEIGNLSKLHHLHFDANELTGNIPSEIWNLSNPVFPFSKPSFQNNLGNYNFFRFIY